MTDYADLRRLAEQAIAGPTPYWAIKVKPQAILALLDEKEAWDWQADVIAERDAAERRVAALEEGLRALVTKADNLIHGPYQPPTWITSLAALDEQVDEARALLASGSAGAGGAAPSERKPLTENPRTDLFEYRVAVMIARHRFGPGIDMGGAHNPRPDEWRLAREIAELAEAAASAGLDMEAVVIVNHGRGGTCPTGHCERWVREYEQVLRDAQPERQEVKR